jgi:hypothetical protein
MQKTRDSRAENPFPLHPNWQQFFFFKRYWVSIWQAQILFSVIVQVGIVNKSVGK